MKFIQLELDEIKYIKKIVSSYPGRGLEMGKFDNLWDIETSKIIMETSRKSITLTFIFRS